MLKQRPVAVFVLCLVAASIAFGAARLTSGNVTLEEADRFYAERSYAKALDGYQQALAADVAGDRKTQIEYRVAVCLGRSERWDDALEHTRTFIEAHSDGLWGARGHYWLGQLLVFVPHQGYRVGDRVYRGEDYPRVAGAEKPERINLWKEDQEGAVAAFEDAKRLYEQLQPRAEKEEADLNFDLADVLGSEDLSSLARVLIALEREKRPSLTARYGEPDPAEVNKLRDHDWTLTPTKPYDPTQPMPQRILGLYEQIEPMEKGRRAPQARLARALYVQFYQQRMREMMRVYDSEKKEWIELPFPYQDLDAIAIIRSIPKEYPKHPIAAQAQLTTGNWLEGKHEFTQALAVYRELIERWPDSTWVSDARERIQDIEWPAIGLATQTARPGEKATIRFNGRNVKTVEFTAYRVRLDRILLRPRLLNNPRLTWQRWYAAFGDIPTGSWRRGEKVATWTHVTQDTGEHKLLGESVAAPLKEVGAYAVEARSGKARAAALVLLTDLAIVQRADKDRALVFVCDADSGRPVQGADVVIREVYNEENKSHVSVERGQSNQDGLKGKPLTRGRAVYHSRVEALAWVGDRYAVTWPLSSHSGWRENRDEYRAYVCTDRPVYRPNQRVHFRAVLTLRSAADQDDDAPGRYQPATDVPVALRVLDPQGEKVHEGNLTTSEFGSVNGSFALNEEAPLGEYTVQVRVPSSTVPISERGSNRFRVEEYKKPEFEVTVTPSAEQARVGASLSAAISARYYFGAPVVGAEVTYRVFRLPYYPRHRFPQRYDWLFRYWNQGDYASYYRNGEAVKEGSGRTDAQGQLLVDLETEGGGRWPDARAYSYTVEAEVTDQSRRTITGTGEVRVSKQQCFAFLDLTRGFYQAGERIELEVATLDVMERPTAVEGRIRVERVVRGASDLVEAVVHEEGVATDDQGRAFFSWVPDEAGQYRFTFEALDAWEQTVTSSIYTWVHGPDFDKAAFRLTGIQLVPDRQTYDEGETCKLLIVSSMPDATVLLTQEAGDQILGRIVVRITGKSRVLEVPMRANHMPNFRFGAVMVRGWQAYQTGTEVFVPPGKQFLDVSVTSDRAEYRPNDEATFRLKATDWRGEPVRAELSIGVVDASLFYIQKEYAPDPRVFFYGERRYVNIAQNWSLQWSPQGASATDLTRQPYKRHEWTLPEDMGQLQDWPPGLRGGRISLRHRVAGRPVGGVRAYALEEMSPLGYFADYSADAVYGGVGGKAGAMLAPPPPAAPPSAEPSAQRADREAGAALAAAQVRTRFADTAFWSPAVVTDADGTATVTVTMPENLTTWRATARGFTTEVQVGEGTAEAVTRKDLIVRLQAPRFFMERDLVVLSANVHNYLKSEKQVKVALALDGGTLELVKDIPADLGLKEPAAGADLWITVPQDGEQRVDWVVRVLRSGSATVRMTAQSDEESDAVEMQFPALVHGVEKFEAESGVMRDVAGSDNVTLQLDVPQERRRGATELNVQLTPSLGAVALDALPYLADYPYGCIEQTMSRFLPTVVVARTLTDLGIDLDELRKRADAYRKELDASAGSQAQPDSGYTYPKGMPGGFDAAEMASRMYLRRDAGPIFDPERLARMVRAGLQRIYAQQHSDGGWGWWPSNVSDPYMTAYVCYGLFTAREADWDIRDEVLERGFQYLLQDMKEDDNLHRLAYIGSVVTLRGAVDDEVRAVIFDRLYRNRIKLTPYSQALLAVALKQIGALDEARVVLDNLENTAHVDRDNGTCNWMPRQRGWWWCRWWDNPVETNAAVLRAYMAIRPDDDLAPMIVKWMVNNRRGNHWSSTKETAMAVYALADFMRVKQELAPDYTVTVDFGGKVQRTYRVNRYNALFFDNRFIVGDEVVGDGTQELTISVKGNGTLYYAAYLRYFSLEEDITGGGNEIFVQRRYFKLTPKLVDKKERGRAWQELAYDRAELASGARLRSGDLIEVELVIEAKNDYEYLVFEDMKPAGCEPVEVRSGSRAGEGAGVYPYIELRDEKVATFISDMPQGTRAVRYRLRAEIPGSFHALPTNGYSMYAPDVRCLSDEWRVGISD
ncbi:MAG: hypothetical protein JSV65_17790 [Armatimonadota bacterium]|nr:MAG: hypothetical protein JSV65_17790 [Armatimonadota bacterium]